MFFICHVVPMVGSRAHAFALAEGVVPPQVIDIMGGALDALFVGCIVVYILCFCA